MLQELRSRNSADIYGWDCPLLTFIYLGFDCGSCEFESESLVHSCLCVCACVPMCNYSSYPMTPLQINLETEEKNTWSPAAGHDLCRVGLGSPPLERPKPKTAPERKLGIDFLQAAAHGRAQGARQGAVDLLQVLRSESRAASRERSRRPPAADLPEASVTAPGACT